MENASTSRQLLRSLHKVMAGKGTGQQKLERLVKEIAAGMEADVCSVYLLNPGGQLELFATEGLKHEAVHKSVLPFGAGLVGHVARTGLPINVPEASKHPKFLYLPETGEEMFHSFTAVPIIRHLQVVGVLVVQSRKAQAYSEVEVEILQTVAMVLAEMMAPGEFGDVLGGITERRSGQATFEGQKLADGLATGEAVFHEPKIEITEVVTDDTAGERERLAAAVKKLQAQLDQLMQAPDLNLFGDHRDVLETYKMFTYDRGWQRRISEAIGTGLTAEAATEKVLQEMRARFIRMRDPYLKERINDLEDLSNRLIRILMGYVGEKAHRRLRKDSILVARTMGPAELLDYDRKHLKGLLLEEGSPTSHVTIVARGLGIPVLGQARGALGLVEEGDRIILDAEAGRAYVRPSEDVEQTFEASRAEQNKLLRIYQKERALPAVTKDGVKISLLMNAALTMDLEHLKTTGAEGIGLFRTEFQFMVSQTLPRMKAQTELYRSVFKAAGAKPVTFRTLDIGGDKKVPFIEHDEETNPALGMRAIRLALSRPGLLRYQIRALVAAAEGRDLRLMFPMIAEISEFLEGRALVVKELERLKTLKRKGPKSVAVGSMIEVPSIVWQLDSLLKSADFVSIGSNDLMQFLFAADRSNPRLSERYDLLSPAALAVVRRVAEAAHRVKVPLTFCGELGGRPLEALALIGLGVRALSLPPSAIGPVKMMVRQLNLKAFRRWLAPELKSPVHSLRGRLAEYARKHNLPY